PFVRRMVPDAGDRPAPLSGVDVFHLQLLPGFTKRTVPATLAADLPLPALSHGAGHRAHADQHPGRARSIVRDQIGVQAHAKISRAVKARPGDGAEIPPASWPGAVA